RRDSTRRRTMMVSGPLVDAASRPISLPAARQRGALSVRWDGFEAITRRIAEETPVAITYNKLPYAVMMATPADLEDFGTGFSITERIVSHPRQISDVQVRDTRLGLHARIGSEKRSRRDALAARRGNVTGRTGCGLCGIRRLEDAGPQRPTVPAGKRVHTSARRAALNQPSTGQCFNAEAHAG